MITEIFLWIVGLLLALAVFFDLKKREIPDSISIMILICGLAAAFLTDYFLQALFAAWIFFTIAFLLSLFEIFGGGDLKLIAALGPSLTFSILYFSNVLVYCFFIGAMFSFIFLLICACSALKCKFKGLPLAPIIFISWIITKGIFFFF